MIEIHDEGPTELAAEQAIRPSEEKAVLHERESVQRDEIRQEWEHSRNDWKRRDSVESVCNDNYRWKLNLSMGFVREETTT